MASALFEVDYPLEAMAAAAASSLLPDLDYPESWLGFLLKPLSEKIAERWKHRGFFHSLLGLLAFELLLYPLYLSGGCASCGWRRCWDISRTCS